MPQEPVREALTTQYVQTLLKIKARQLSRRPEFRRSDPADIKQDLVVQVLKQAHHFDPARGCVKTFVARVVDSAIAMMVRGRRRLKRAPGFRALSLENTFVGRCRGELPICLGEVIQEGHLRRRCGGQVRDDRQAAELAAAVDQAMEGLTPRQREIAKRLAQATEASVAREMGISRRQVRNAVLTIRDHFRRAGLSEN